MLQRLWRQRRRLTVTAVLAASGGALSGGPADAFSVILILLGVALVLVLPPWRFLAERLALCHLAEGLVPALGLPTVAGAEDRVLLYLVVLAAAGAGAHALTRIRLPAILTARAERRIEDTPRAAWIRLLPQETREPWNPALREIAVLPDGRYRMLRASALGPLPALIVAIRGSERDRMLELAVREEGPRGAVATLLWQMEPAGEGMRIEALQARWSVDAATALDDWLDDRLADGIDQLAAEIEERPDWSITTAETAGRRPYYLRA